MDCLSQSLEIALTTALGSDIFNTDFGFDGLRALAEETSAVLVRERVRISVVRVLQKDARIRGILDVSLGDGAARTGSGFGRLEVSVGFETVSGEQATASLGRVDRRG